MIEITSVVVVSPNQVARDLDGETVILQLEVGRYFGLNGVASQVWTLIQQPRAVVEIRDILVAEYEVAAEQCEKDLQMLLEDFLHKGLVQVVRSAES